MSNVVRLPISNSTVSHKQPPNQEFVEPAAEPAADVVDLHQATRSLPR
jgi:hypothetical protein